MKDFILIWTKNKNFILDVISILISISFLILTYISINTIFLKKKWEKEEEIQNNIWEENLTLFEHKNSIINNIEKIESEVEILKDLESKSDSSNTKLLFKNSKIKEKLIFEKCRKEKELKKKIEELKENEKKNSLINYLTLIKENIEVLSNDDIKDLIVYIESKF